MSELLLYSSFINKNKQLINELKYPKKIFSFLNKIRCLQKRIRALKEKLSPTFLNSLEKELTSVLDKFFNDAVALEEDINNPALLINLKDSFRMIIKEYLSQSPFLHRAYLKPKGYPGDFKMLEAMYNNTTTSDGMGFLLDQYFLKNNYVQAVRERKDRMKEVLKRTILDPFSSSLKILNLACGSCREIRELFAEGFMPNKKIEFILVDQDKETLEFARKELRQFPQSKKYKFHFIQNHVLFWLRDERVEKKFEGFDFIYSIGLADYLSDNILGHMMECALLELKNNGHFFIAHKYVCYCPAPAPDWMCDWKFISRDQKELLNLVKKYLGESNYEMKSFEEKSRLIFYLIFKKK